MDKSIIELCRDLKRMAFLGKPSTVMAVAKRIEVLDSERNKDMDKLYEELIASRKELQGLKDNISALIKEIEDIL